MIHEYALEPELVAKWGNPYIFCFVLDKFGLGTSRIVSAFPENWMRITYDACYTTDDIERAMLIEILNVLSEKMITRNDYNYDASLPWLECAELEHHRIPFKAIVASRNPRNLPDIILNTELGMSKNDRRWITNTFPTLRQAKAMANAIEPMLSNCSEVILVDPYFTPAEPKKTKPLQAFLKSLMNNRKSPVTRLDVVIKYDETKGDNDSFRIKCLNILPNYMPAGLTLTVLRIAERKGKEQIHNRYVLTDIGGVNFGAGLDEGKEGQTDDVGLLSRSQYEMRWRQYSQIVAMENLGYREYNLVGDPIKIESNV